MSDLISKAKLFNRLATVQTLAEAYAVIQEMKPEDVIPLGVEMWADRFHIRTRIWWSEDKQTEAKLFVITRREQKDG